MNPFAPSQAAEKMVHAVRGGFVCREPGYTRLDDDRVIEVVEHQDFFYNTQAACKWLQEIATDQPWTHPLTKSQKHFAA